MILELWMVGVAVAILVVIALGVVSALALP